MATLHFDGSCGPKNPGGTAAYGYVLDLEGGYPIYGRGVIGEGPGMTNNLAELWAAASGIEEFAKRCSPADALWVKGDSKLTINLLMGRYRAREDKAYYPGFQKAMKALRSLPHGVTVQFSWVPREENELCDTLSKTHRGDGPLPMKYSTPYQKPIL